MAVSNQDIIDFLNANPGMSDADIAKAMTQYGVSAAQMAAATGLAQGDVASRFLTQQILGQNTASKWTGEGYGSAEANAKAMAKLLADANITDIKQFGKVDKYEPVEVAGYTLNGKPVQNPSAGVFYEQIPQYDYEGGIQGYQARYLSPQEASQVQPTYQTATPTSFDSNGNAVYTPIDPSKVVQKDGQLVSVAGQTFGNKETGEAINQGSGRWLNQGGEDLFSGTGEGKGNTAFRAQFDAQGNPIFYTTQGSSSDFTNIMPAVQLVLAATGAGGLLGGALGLTGAAANAVGTGLLSTGTAALGGADFGDALKAGLLSGGLVYGGNLLSNPDAVVDFNNMTADQLDEALQTNLVKDLKNAGVTNPSEFLTGQGGNAAKFIQESVAATDLANNLANQGLSSNEIAQLLDSVGVTPTAITDALDSLPATASTGGLMSSVVAPTATESVNIAAQAPVSDVSSLFSAPLTTPITTPVTNAGTVDVASTSTPQQVDQAVLNLVNSQLASNVTTPANLANVEVTTQQPTQTNTDVLTSLLPTITTPTIPTVVPETPVANVEVTGDKGLMSGNTTVTDILNTLASLPVTTPVSTPVTTPTVTTPEATPTQTITSEKPVVTTQDLINTIAATLPIVTTPVTTPTITTPTQTITAEKPVTTQEATNIVTSLLPTITPTQAATIAEQVVTTDRPVTKEDVVSAVTSVIPSLVTPTVTTPVVPEPEVTVTAPKTPKLEDVITPIVSTIPVTTPTVTTPTVTTPTVTTPEVTVTAPKTPTLSDVVTPIAAVIPPVVTPPVTTPVTSTPNQTIIAERPTTINDVVNPATIPLIQPTTPLAPATIPSQPTNKTTNPLGLTDAQLLNILKAGLGLFGSTAAATGIGGSSSRGIGALPTQGVPLYSQDYFNQIQQNYNRLLPSTPRDVSTPLSDWYNSQYGA